MLKILYGRNRSKKTEYIYSMIDTDLKSGEKVILLVPEQTVLEAEKALCELDIYSLDCEVMSFRRLCNSIFRKYGGLCYNYITKAGKHAVIWKALKLLSPMLKKYSDSAIYDKNLPSMLLSAVEEFHTYKLSPNTVMEASSAFKDDADFSNTLFDLSQIYALYTDILHEKYDDPSDDLTAAEIKLRENNFFRGIKVYIDGFSGFTKEELSLLAHIFGESYETTLTLGYEKHEKSEAFERLVNTDRVIRRAADTRHVQVIDEYFDAPMESAEIDFLSKELWRFSGRRYTEKVQDISIISCRDRNEEAKATALDIKKNVLAGGRYRDFTVVVGNCDNYRTIIEAAFEKYGIPYFLSKRTDAKTKSQVRLILSALMIKVYGWQTEHVISYIQSGLTSLEENDIDVLSEYAAMWKIRGKRWYDENEWRMNPKGFGFEYDDEVREELCKINKLRKEVTDPLVEFFEAFEGESTVRKVSGALFKYLERLDLLNKINEGAAKKRSENRNAEADEDAQLWNSIINILDTFVNIAGDTVVTPAEYTEVLSSMFENTDIGRIPSGVDEVQVTSAGLYRRAGTEKVYLLGANEKMFPAAVEETGILGEEERERLAEYGIELDKKGESAFCDELLHFYNALTSGKKGACILYNENDGASFAVKAVSDLFSQLEKTDMSRVDAIDKIASPITAVEYAATCKDRQLSERIFDLAVKKDTSLIKIKDALNIPLMTEQCRVGENITDKISEKGLSLSQSKAQKYIECPFSFFCRYVVKMKPVGSGDIEQRDIGNYVHKVLEMFFLRVKDRDISNISDKECDSITREVIEEYKGLVIKYDIDKRTMCLFDRLEELSKLLIKNLVNEFRVSKFTPKLFEYPIGGRDGIPSLPIELEDGTKIYMNGFIDRVDIYKNSDKLYIRIVDYKTGKKVFKLEDIEKGVNLQMFIYLFTLCFSSSDKFLKEVGAPENCSLHPAGALYFLAGMPNISSDDGEPEDVAAAMDEVMKSIKRNGLLISDIDVLSAMEPGLNGLFIPVRLDKSGSLAGRDLKNLASEDDFQKIKERVISKIVEIGQNIKSGIADALPLDESEVCKYCDVRAICRRAKAGEDE